MKLKSEMTGGASMAKWVKSLKPQPIDVQAAAMWGVAAGIGALSWVIQVSKALVFLAFLDLLLSGFSILSLM